MSAPKKKMLFYLPAALIILRLIMGPALIMLSVQHISGYSVIAIVILIAGLLSDIFDGIIARKLGISTQKLRRLDSSADQVFFICIAIATYIQCPSFFHANAVNLFILFGAEGLTYLLCFIKFRKEIATHTIGAKLWTLLLTATLVQVMLQCNSGWLFTGCFWIGLLTRAEIIAIILILKDWANDVPTFLHAIRMRKGKEIKRHKLFNG